MQVVQPRYAVVRPTRSGTDLSQCVGTADFEIDRSIFQRADSISEQTTQEEGREHTIHTDTHQLTDGRNAIGPCAVAASCALVDCDAAFSSSIAIYQARIQQRWQSVYGQ